MPIEDESVRRNRNNSWWKQRTNMEHKLIFVIMIATLLIIALSIGTAVAATSGSRGTCVTDSCVKEAAHLLNRMNTTVDPCDDFYEFVCGRFIQNTVIPDDKAEVNPLILTSELLNLQVRQLIEEPAVPTELRAFSMMKKMYASCMNTTAIEQRGLEPMKKILQRLGGWPVLEKNNWVELNWIEITRKLRQNGFEAAHLINLDTDINPKNSSEYIVLIDQAKNEEIGDENLKNGLNDELVELYANYLIDLAVLFGADREFATKDVHAVIEFRAKIAEISAGKADHILLILAANESLVADLEKDYPSIAWLDVINWALAIPNKTITSQDKVMLTCPLYMAKLETFINSTPKRVLSNHALFQVVRSLVPYLPRNIRDREQEFMGKATGVIKALPRWNVCIIKTTESFNIAADALYVRRNVDEAAKTDVTVMVTHLKSVFARMLKAVEWMDSNTKRQAIEKVEAITAHIAYPTELREDKNIDEYYADVTNDSDDILEIVNKMAKLKRDKLVRFYGGPVIKNHWTTRFAVTTCNAVYDPQGNSVQIPSGIMQNEFYDKDRPHYMNYGGFGMVIGHEITHGFDNTGKGFNKMGNTANWWEESTDKAFATKAECFVNQYGNFTVPELNITLNGINTLGENIADNGGIKEAYFAYLEWTKYNKEELPLPGIEYSPKQLFWISIANAWCTKSRNSALEQMVIGDEHSPNRYRILGGFSNNEFFAKDFNCPVGSKMNPAKKCQVW